MKGRPAETLLDNRDLTNLMDAAVVQVSKPVSFLFLHRLFDNKTNRLAVGHQHVMTEGNGGPGLKTLFWKGCNRQDRDFIRFLAGLSFLAS